MAILSRERAVQSSAEACENFINTYYKTLNEHKSVASYYVTNNQTYCNAGHPPADICINGLVLATPAEWDAMLAAQRQAPGSSTASSTTTHRPFPVTYEVESWDAHVINPDYRFAAPPALLVPDPSKSDHGAGIRIMTMLTVSGTVHFTNERDGESFKQHFNDVFILVPNWDILARHGKNAVKRYLIASHNYRAF
ncbi:hypothetical protein B0T16DRAFT_429808 [Cercophora newfieldiana]|uniref:NTF2 domain-containing protein n=1 Tax=Cercophora newfieldiana TaxID=92897 RepID=A0AA40CLL6_9PEZI|nr:hypothetical protein B0T16DRAFT_429808 [Cercophora newfieldiana]